MGKLRPVREAHRGHTGVTWEKGISKAGLLWFTTTSLSIAQDSCAKWVFLSRVQNLLQWFY